MCIHIYIIYTHVCVYIYIYMDGKFNEENNRELMMNQWIDVTYSYFSRSWGQNLTVLEGKR